MSREPCSGMAGGRGRSGPRAVHLLAAFALFLAMAAPALAHDIGGRDAQFVASTNGVAILPFVYLGAKHMVTGYDHLLFLAGVIFFLYRLRDIVLYVSLFSIGHSITLLAGVLMDVQVSAYLVDAIIGLSVVYKAFDNLGGFRRLFGFQPDNRVAVLGFGLIHGLGLATKLQALDLQPRGMIVNLVSFNVGVEIGQLIALSIILGLMILWRRTRGFGRLANAANVAIMVAGFVLAGHQLAGHFVQGGV